ncbi:hypothetical protein JCM10207_008934 [Rhodosporidiobolus poonsookiae]
MATRGRSKQRQGPYENLYRALSCVHTQLTADPKQFDALHTIVNSVLEERDSSGLMAFFEQFKPWKMKELVETMDWLIEYKDAIGRNYIQRYREADEEQMKEAVSRLRRVIKDALEVGFHFSAAHQETYSSLSRF